MKRLKIISNDVHPDATTNGRLLMDIAVGLVEKGDWDVEFLASTPRRNSRGVEKPPRDIGGVRIRRFWNPHFKRRSVFGRLINSLTVCSQIFLRLLFTRRPDVLLVDTTSTFQGPTAWLLSLVRRFRYVYLATELYPDVAVALGFLNEDGLLRKAWDWTNRRVYGRASGVIVIGPLLREKVARHLPGGATDPKLHVIHNWADTEAIKPVEPADNWFRTKHGLGGKLVVLYSGNAGLSHDVETLIEAADILRDDPRIGFMFIGGGPKRPKIEKMASDRGLTNVKFLPFQPPEVLPYSLSSGDLSVVTLERAMDDLTIPSKLYPAMAAGQAILALMSPNSDVGKLVEELEVGIRVEQGDAEGLAQNLKEMAGRPESIAAMKQRARAAAVEQFGRQHAVDAYAEVLQAAISER